MKEICPKCKKKTIQAKPPKYSPKVKYASYRREEKKKGLQEKGLY